MSFEMLRKSKGLRELYEQEASGKQIDEQRRLETKHMTSFKDGLKSLQTAILETNLRDQFAMAALQGLYASNEISKLQSGTYMEKLTAIAEVCYEMADAMMEARKK
jgi:hypothetical protein